MWGPHVRERAVAAANHPVFLGVYHARTYGQDDEVRFTLKNGHLYWNGRLKLIEYRPGLFFTGDGDSVQFAVDTVASCVFRMRRLTGRCGRCACSFGCDTKSPMCLC